MGGKEFSFVATSTKHPSILLYSLSETRRTRNLPSSSLSISFSEAHLLLCPASSSLSRFPSLKLISSSVPLLPHQTRFHPFLLSLSLSPFSSFSFQFYPKNQITSILPPNRTCSSMFCSLSRVSVTNPSFSSSAQNRSPKALLALIASTLPNRLYPSKSAFSPILFFSRPFFPCQGRLFPLN